jgi:hypothetical protein
MSRIIGVRQSCATFNPKMLPNRHLYFLNDLSHFYHMPEFKRSYNVGLALSGAKSAVGNKWLVRDLFGFSWRRRRRSA